MKILFLDIDGVLNSAAVLADKGRHDAIDRDMVERINRVVRDTGCNIVISSTWRLLWPLGELKALLRQHGMIDVVIGQTPRLDRRDNEILEWLAEHPEVTRFVAVDDDTFDMTAINHRLVATSFQTGMLDHHADQAIAILNKA